MPGATTTYGKGVQKVPADAPVEDVIALLKRDGGVFIKGLVSEADIDQAYDDCRARIDNDKVWEGKFFPSKPANRQDLNVVMLTRSFFLTEETQRAPGLLALSPTYARTQLMHPLYRAVCDHFLTTRTWNWWGDEWKESVSKPYVHSCTAMRIGPGGKAQPLHRDDYISHNLNPEVDSWDDERDMRRETAIGMFVAGSRVTKANGGTQFIPGSHLW